MARARRREDLPDRCSPWWEDHPASLPPRGPATRTCSRAAAVNTGKPAAYLMRSPGRASRWVLPRMEPAAPSRAR
jgi:hypothetical protein